MNIFPIPAFADNYLWLLSEGRDAVVVDPGDAAPVQRHLETQGLTLRAILVTHWHPDHIGGIAKLRGESGIPVYGPRAESARIPTLTHPLDDGDTVNVLGWRFEVLALPGHTLGHIAFYSAPTLFCGDTLFSAGCGRLFEGTPQQMHHSLQKLAALPDDTQVYCTHEYTLSNLAFAQTVEPENKAIAAHIEKVKALRTQQQPSVPTTLALEKQINPYLRVQIPAVRQQAASQAQQPLAQDDEVFAALRRWKDHFKPPAA